MRKAILPAFVAAIIFVACQRQVNGPQNTPINDSLNQEAILDAKAAPVCFEGDVLPIFQTNCAKSGCHDAQSHKEGYVLDNYQDITKKGIVPYNPQESEVYQAIAEGEMPPRPNPKLTTEQVTLIRRWIRQGAKNTTNCSTCDTTQYTYSGTISAILTTNCVGCHNSTVANGGVDLSTYQGTESAALNGTLVGTVTHAAGYPPMPLNGPMLSDCNITQIEEWVAAGAPNN